jgi:hypothetical protein
LRKGSGNPEPEFCKRTNISRRDRGAYVEATDPRAAGEPPKVLN